MDHSIVRVASKRFPLGISGLSEVGDLQGRPKDADRSWLTFVKCKGLGLRGKF